MSSEEPPYQCYGCQKDMPDYKPAICCNGHECGCMGRPLEPPICSNECWYKVFPPYKGPPVDDGEDDKIPF